MEGTAVAISVRTVNVAVSHDVEALPVGRVPQYVGDGLIGVCTGGTVLLELFGTQQRVSGKCLVVVFPRMLASMTDVGEDFSMTFMPLSYNLLMEVLGGMQRMSPDFFFYMRRHFVIPLSDEEYERCVYFMRLLDMKSRNGCDSLDREGVVLLLRVLFWEVYVRYRQNAVDCGATVSHKEKLVFQFINLVYEHMHVSHEVGFYAGRMCISPKYLSMVVHDVAGMSAKALIVDCVLAEVKTLLRDMSLDVKDVARLTNFQNQSMLGRFFRHHTGMSPSQYRASLFSGAVLQH